ncbi:unannotated protein [freshwater metagenome]|uniref:Unannotated protein n=1 Tax=freshwater metagenome TaxID=449393 RepID=A0A6J6AC77_9ZZZZ
MNGRAMKLTLGTVFALTGVLLVPVGCGKKDAKVTAVTTTTAQQSTSTMQPAAPVISRETLLAITRCTDSLGFGYAEMVATDYRNGNEAKALCEEAKVQIEVDQGTGADLGNLMVAVAYLDVEISFLNLAAFEPMTAAAIKDYQDKVDKAVADVDTAVAAVS